MNRGGAAPAQESEGGASPPGLRATGGVAAPFRRRGVAATTCQGYRTGNQFSTSANFLFAWDLTHQVQSPETRGNPTPQRSTPSGTICARRSHIDRVDWERGRFE
jgi:hypothetical protein